MLKTKSTKRALLMSALSLLLCVSMLIGTTFAWFTDSVTSGRNTIQSGNLDVELYYALSAKDVADEKWTAVTSATNVFGYDNWEPGYTQVAYFKVVNKGSLALKYQLTADVYSEVAGINKDGKEFLLSKSLKYGVTETVADLASREKAAAVANKDFGSFELKASALEAGKEAIVGMVITMPTTVGNEANHNGTDIPSIAFGINLLATQYTHESDSFDNQYDKDATIDGAAFTHGGIVNVEQDMEDEVVVGEDAEVTLNLNDKALNNVLTNNGNVTVSDGEINVDGNNALYNEGTAELKDVTLNMTGNTGYITNSRTDSSMTVYEDVNITSSGGGVNVWQGEAVFKSGTITLNSTSTSARHIFYVADGAKLTIEDGEFFFNPTNLTRKGSYICADANSTVIVKGGTFHKPSTRTAPIQAVNGSTVEIMGGTFQFDPGAFVAAGYVATENGGWWTVTKA